MSAPGAAAGTSPYPRWDGAATVANVRREVRAMVAEAHGPEDRVVFVDSSHGNGDGRGSSYLVMLPDPIVGSSPDEVSGQYWDRDLAADLSRGYPQGNDARVFVFLDRLSPFVQPSLDGVVRGKPLATLVSPAGFSRN